MMGSPASEIIREAHAAAMAAGVRFNNRRVQETAAAMVEAGITPSAFRTWLDARYQKLRRIRFDSLPVIFEDWKKYPPGRTSLQAIDLNALKDSL